jgi:hypothetical protein
MPPDVRVPTSKVRTDDTADNHRWHVPSLPAEERLLLNGIRSLPLGLQGRDGLWAVRAAQRAEKDQEKPRTANGEGGPNGRAEPQ